LEALKTRLKNLQEGKEETKHSDDNADNNHKAYEDDYSIH
jgi:hypothetical protein